MKKGILFLIAVILSTTFLSIAYAQSASVPELKYVPYNFPANLVPGKDFQVIRSFSAKDSYKAVTNHNVVHTIKHWGNDPRPNEKNYLPNVTTRSMEIDIGDKGRDLFLFDSLYKKINGSISDSFTTKIPISGKSTDDTEEFIDSTVPYSLSTSFVYGVQSSSSVSPKNCDKVDGAYVNDYAQHFQCPDRLKDYFDSGLPTKLAFDYPGLSGFNTPFHDVRGTLNFTFDRDDTAEGIPEKDKSKTHITVHRRSISFDSLVIPPAAVDTTYVVEVSVEGYKTSRNNVVMHETPQGGVIFDKEVQLIDPYNPDTCNRITINGIETKLYKNFANEKASSDYIVGNDGQEIYKYRTISNGRCYAYFYAKSGSKTDITPKFSISTSDGLVTYDLRVKVSKPKIPVIFEEEKCKLIAGSGAKDTRKIVFMKGKTSKSSNLEAIAQEGVDNLRNYDPFKSKTYFDRLSFYVDTKSIIDDDKLPSKDMGLGYNFDFFTSGADKIVTSTSLCGSDALEYVLIESNINVSQSHVVPGGKVVYINEGSTGIKVLAHESGHAIGRLNDEYLLAEVVSSMSPYTNCVKNPKKDYRYKNEVYGSPNFQGCFALQESGGSKLYRPSRTSLMSEALITDPDTFKFNVISCGYIIAAIKGEKVDKDHAQKYWPECMKMDTIDAKTVPAAQPNPSPSATPQPQSKNSNTSSVITTWINNVFGIDTPNIIIPGKPYTMKVSNLTPTDNAVSFTDAKDPNITDEIIELNSDGKSLTFTLSPTSPVVTSKTGNDIYIKIGAYNSPWSDPLKFTISSSDVKDTPVLSPKPTLSPAPNSSLTPNLPPKTTDSIIAVPLVKTTNTSDLNPAQYIPSTVSVDNGSKFSVNVRLLGKTQKATITAQCPTNTSLVEEVVYKQSSNIQSVPLCGTSVDILPIPSQALIFTSQNQTSETQNIILTLTQTDAEGQSTKSTSRISVKPGPKPIKTVVPTVTPNVTPSVSPTQSTTPSPTSTQSPKVLLTPSPLTSVKPSASVSPTKTPTPSSTPIPTTTTLPSVSSSPIQTSIPVPTSKYTPSPSVVPSVTSKPAPAIVPSPAQTSTPTPTPVVSVAPVVSTTPVVTSTPSVSPSVTVNASSRRESIRQLYLTMLKREPDTAGLDYWTSTSYTIDQIQQQFVNGAEYQNLIRTTSTNPSATASPSASASLPVFRATLWDAVKVLFWF